MKLVSSKEYRTSYANSVSSGDDLKKKETKYPSGNKYTYWFDVVNPSVPLFKCVEYLSGDIDYFTA